MTRLSVLRKPVVLGNMSSRTTLSWLPFVLVIYCPFLIGLGAGSEGLCSLEAGCEDVYSQATSSFSNMPKKNIEERSFIMLKPDAVQRGLMSDIFKRFEQRGYKLVALKMMQAPKELLERHYGDLKTKPFFPSLVEFMSSGPVIPSVWEGSQIVLQARQMLGETDPLKSKPGSIRGDYSIDVGRNIIHASDSVESAEHEINMWFTPEEIASYSKTDQKHIYE